MKFARVFSQIGIFPIAAAVVSCSGTATIDQPSNAVDYSQSKIMTGAEVRSAENYDSSPPLTLLPPAPRQTQLVEHEVKRWPRRQSNTAQVPDPVIQSTLPALLMPAPATNFDGVGNGVSGPAGTFTVASAPPDTNGDVGPNHYVQTVNTDFAVFNKSTGAILFGPVPINTLWSNFGGGCQTNNDGDPVVVYDPIADRWIISQFSVSTTPNLQCIAVSQTPDPTGAYNRYSFSYTDFPDYPKMGVWPDAYYETFNMFAGGTTFSGGTVCAYDRTKMLAGQAATQQCFSVGSSFGGLLPGDMDGHRLPPSGEPNPVLSLGATDGQLAYWKFHVDFTTPANTTLTGPAVLTTAAFTLACNDTGGTCVPQSGTTQQLDTLGDRMMFRLAYRNFGDHESLVANHTATAGSSTGIRWYELRLDSSHNASIFQQGTYAPDTNFRWMGSIAMDQSGNIALGFSLSSATLDPQIHYTGRLASDPAGQMSQGETDLFDGAGSQGTGLSRWGDYSNMTIDPADDCTFWYTDEYIPSNGTFNWKTRIGSFKFPGCGGTVTNDFSIAANPASLTVTAGNSATSTISTAVTSGSAQAVALSASGLPSGATASFNPGSVSSGGSSTLTLSTGASTPAGTYSVTVTGTGTSATHTTAVTLVVNAVVANDFSISASPNSVTVTAGNSATSTIATAVTSGSAQTVSLSASGLPSGATASFNPTSVTAGGSSTLTLTTSASTPAGTYSVTVTGTGTSATHTTAVTLVVNAVVANDFSISASPSTVTVTAGNSGTSTLSTAVTSGSAQSVSLSASGLPAGATASFNPTSVTAGGNSTLTLSTGAGTAAGTYTVTVTGTGTSATHTTAVTLVVNAVVANDFSISASPSSLSVTAGNSGTSTISTAVTSGSAQSVSLSASGLPAGASASFNPTSVTAGGSSTLTVSTGASTPAGSYSVTVTGTGTSATHTANISLTVSGATGSAIVNGGFETGDYTGWSHNGAATAVNSAAKHTGNFGSQNGLSTPTNGDSNVVQTFTAPSGTNALSFWYNITCPDSVTYDWVTATLRDNTAGTTNTVLPKICVPQSGWTNVQTPLVAGHNYTLTLTSHDDDYAADPTFTYFDDVAIVAVTPPPTGITNGGFETGNLNGWTPSGAATAVNAAAKHTGSFGAENGLATPTTGDSTIVQSFTVPTGASKLSFFYSVHCPDTVTYDWVTATLKDNTTGATQTLVPKTCNNTGAWVQVTSSVTVGHSYTLTLTSHDDDYAADPTFTYFDDVTLQ